MSCLNVCFLLLICCAIRAQDCLSIKNKIESNTEYEILYDSSIKVMKSDTGFLNDSQAKKKLKGFKLGKKDFIDLVNQSVKVLDFKYRPNRFLIYEDAYFKLDKKKLLFTIGVEEYRIIDPGKGYEGYEVTKCKGILRCFNRAYFTIKNKRLELVEWLY